MLCIFHTDELVHSTNILRNYLPENVSISEDLFHYSDEVSPSSDNFSRRFLHESGTFLDITLSRQENLLGGLGNEKSTIPTLKATQHVCETTKLSVNIENHFSFFRLVFSSQYWKLDFRNIDF